MLIKKIHRVWINDNRDIPYHIYRREWIDSWDRLHQGWEFHLWDNEKSRQLIETDYPWFLPVYDAYDKPIFKADAICYFILHRFGGLYVDLDFECFKPVDQIFEPTNLCLISKNPNNGHLPEPRQPNNLINSLMYSKPGHRLWKEVIKSLIANKSKRSVMTKTGPFLLTRAYLDYVQHNPNDITLLGPELFLPYLSDTSARKMGDSTRIAELNEKGADYFPDSYGAHRWVSYWSRSD